MNLVSERPTSQPEVVLNQTLNGGSDGVLWQSNTCALLAGLRGYMVWIQGSDYTIIGNQVANWIIDHGRSDARLQTEAVR